MIVRSEVHGSQSAAGVRPPADLASECSLAADQGSDRRPISPWRFFGTGVVVGLIAALSMIAAISMIYPLPAP
jgi:hypothetical protein